MLKRADWQALQIAQKEASNSVQLEFSFFEKPKKAEHND